MFGIHKKDAPKPAAPDADEVGGPREGALEQEHVEEPEPTVLFSDKLPEELEEEIAEAQANLRRIREETHEMITEEHPEIEREDTIDKAHDRGEL